MARKTVQAHYTPGAQITGKAGAALTAGTFVKVSAEWTDRRNPVVVPAAAGDEPFGVVRQDALKDDFAVVYRGSYVVDMLTDGAIAAGDKIMVGAAGKAKKHADTAKVLGVAVSAAKDSYVTVALV